jgi:hypothetical protein
MHLIIGPDAADAFHVIISDDSVVGPEFEKEDIVHPHLRLILHFPGRQNLRPIRIV